MSVFQKDMIQFGYNRAQATVESGVTSDPIVVGTAYNAMTVAAFPEGTAKVQFTICSRKDIENNTAFWLDWDIGETTEYAVDTIYGVISALRVVSINGPVTMKVVAR